jgi:MYXO-CTERM domain-containing protein
VVGLINAGKITSSSANGVTTRLAIASAGDVGKNTFGGLTVAPTDTLVMYSYGGDANLSGFIDADDYFQIDSNYGETTNALKSFRNGDFNLDGDIDGDDYAIIDAGFSGQGSPIASADSVSSMAAVPEPAGVAAGVVALALFRRRRRPLPRQKT